MSMVDASNVVPERSAWRAIMELHAALLPLYERAMIAEFAMPLTWYDVLHHLDEAGEGGLRMNELAAALTLSKSGLTTLVDRIEESGLISRRDDPADRRATVVALTASGRRIVRDAIRAHKELVRKHFLDRMSPDEQLTVSRILGRVLDEIRSDQAAS